MATYDKTGRSSARMGTTGFGRMPPPCFPPVLTVRRWFYQWRDNGLWLSLNHTLLLIGREAAGREASPSAGVIGSESVKTTESGGPRGYDASKKIKGRKRHILTDTEGNLVHAVIHTADIQDRDGAPRVLAGIIQRSDATKGSEVLCRDAGSLNARWHGSTETDASPRTSSRPSSIQLCTRRIANHEIKSDSFESDS